MKQLIVLLIIALATGCTEQQHYGAILGKPEPEKKEANKECSTHATINICYPE